MWSLERTALGTDSPLTAAGDMLDEIRFAKRTLGLSDDDLFEMCTTRPASILRLSGGEGTIRSGARADLLVIRDQGGSPASELTRLDYTRIEMVIVGGEVRLVSDSALSRLPQADLRGLFPLQINSSLFWVRAPLPKLFAEAHVVLGETLQLGKKQVTDAR